MGSIFGKPKEAKIAPPPPIEPPPIVAETGVEEAEKRRLKRRRGRKETFLTGDLIPETEKKRQFG